MVHFLSSPCFLPCPIVFVSYQVSESPEDVDIHKNEIIRHVEVFVSLAFSGEQITGECRCIEKNMHPPDGCIHSSGF